MDRVLSHRKILVVDDEPVAREMTRELLSEYYVHVFTAATALEGLEKIQVHRPHLIVSDIGMPQMDGHQFMREIRSLPPQRGGNTQAIALSAFTQPRERVKSLEAGFQHHLTKPVDFQILLDAVESLLHNVHTLSISDQRIFVSQAKGGQFQGQPDKPSVRLLLAALSWLTNRPNPSDPATQIAIAHHIHMLLLHPLSNSFDLQAALDMAGRTGMDVDELLARISAVATNPN